MADFVTTLVDMGFDRTKAETAVSATGNVGVEAAMEWILSHSDSTETNTSPPDTETNTQPQEMEVEHDSANEPKTDLPRSYKCEDCGKILKDGTEMEFHAAKTQHVNFSESTEEKKPLTPEEKAAQMKRIEEKLKEKRAEREAKEKLDALDREKMRIKSGKEILEAKKRNDEQQMKEIIEARRREKMDDKAARERVRAQIEEDKAARKAKQGGEQGAVAPVVKSPTKSPPTGEKKDYKETKIQLRLPSGKALIQTFGAQEPLAAVRLYVEINRDDGATGPFNLMSTFPRKIYEGDEYNTPLDALGLVPSAVLMVTRSIG